MDFPSPFGPLIKVIEEELGIADDLRDKIWADILDVFQQWKYEQGYRRPGITGHTFSDFESAEPWQCADFTVRNNIDLGIRLWIDGYGPFTKLSKKNEQMTVFGVLLIHEASRYFISASHDLSSVIHLASIFLRYRLAVYKSRLELQESRLESGERRLEGMAPLVMTGAKTRRNLSEGRPAGALANKHRAEEMKKLWRQVAFETFKHNPGWRYDQVVRHIQKQPFGRMKNKPYSSRRIEDVIRGTKDEALQAPSKHSNS